MIRKLRRALAAFPASELDARGSLDKTGRNHREIPQLTGTITTTARHMIGSRCVLRLRPGETVDLNGLHSLK